MSRAMCRLLWIPSLIAFFSLIFVFARQPLAMAPPTSFTTYTSSDKTLLVNHPSNWKPFGMAIPGSMAEVTFEPGHHVFLHIKADLAGSLMADIAKSSSQQTESLSGAFGDSSSNAPPPRAKPPIETLHEQQAEIIAKGYPGYQEGITTSPRIGGLESRMTDFNYQRDTMFGKRDMAGFRVTIITNDRRVTIISRFPKELQQEIEPVCRKIAASIKMEQGS